jgi:hypothetical protein
MFTPLTSIINLFEKLFSEADEKLVDVILSDNSKEVYLTAPAVVLTLYKKALLVNDLLNHIPSQTPFLLNRITIFPSAGWEIMLYHKDFSISRETWMKSEVPILLPQKSKEDNKTILYF